MTTDTIKDMGPHFHRAADSLADTLARLDNARVDRLAFLRRCSKDSTARLAALKEEIRTLEEQIPKWDAEAVRLASQTAEDLLRQALDAVQEQPKPEPYRAGLPPERLRKVWAEWEDETGIVQLRKNGDGWEYRYAHWPNEQEWGDVYSDIWGSANIRPHGATWSRVEAMADAADKKIIPCPICSYAIDSGPAGARRRCPGCEVLLEMVLADGALLPCEVTGGAVLEIVRPVENCRHVAADGTCAHPNAQTPECHDGVVCPVKAEKPKRSAADPRYDNTADNYPTLLDLTKLPPGTVCEAEKNGFFAKGWRYRILGHLGGFVRVSTVEWGGEGEVLIDPMQPARVVKEGGEQ